MYLVVGAGPAGSRLATRLAEAGKEVMLLEEHDTIGKPVQCTGIVTKAFDKFELPKSLHMNELSQVVVKGGGKEISIPLDEHVLDRHMLDHVLGKEAVKAGVDVRLQHRFLGRDGKIAKVRSPDGEVSLPFDFLAGCDGPNSSVALSSGLQKPSSYYIAAQATVKGSFDVGTFETYFGDVAPKFFAWNVPEHKNFSRIGLATMERPGEYFKKLLEVTGGEVTDTQGGIIPVYDPRAKILTKDTVLLGDAGAMIKATTGGGIITSMLQADIVADMWLGRPWKRAWRKLRRELWIHRQLRLMMNRFSDRDYEKLLSLMDSRAVKDILYHHPREYPSKFMYKLVLANPRLAWFGAMKWGW